LQRQDVVDCIMPCKTLKPLLGSSVSGSCWKIA
jgi:hypothetical protein